MQKYQKATNKITREYRKIHTRTRTRAHTLVPRSCGYEATLPHTPVQTHTCVTVLSSQVEAEC